MKRIAEDHGFQATIEKVVLDGHGHIDVALERGDLTIACEISISTRADHEIQNLTKCFASGFDRAVLVCSELRTLAAAREAFGGDVDRVTCVIPEELGACLDSFTLGSRTMPESTPSGAQQSQETPLAGRGIPGTKPTQPELGPRQILIARDAATYLGIAKQTLAKHRWAGTSPPFYKVGRQVVYERAELDSWLALRRHGSTTA